MDGGADQIYAIEYAGSVSLPKMMETENIWMQLEVMFSKVWEGGDIKNELITLDNNINYVLNASL